jgi:hypothetical protein
VTDQAQVSDPELNAISVCLSVLLPLAEAARTRVLAYLTERLASEAITHNGSNNT